MRRFGRLVLVLGLALAILVGPAPAPAPAVAQGEVKIEWLGWMFYRLTSPNGVVVLASPYLTNPDSQVTLSDITRADIILAPNAHGDDFGQAVEIANQTGGKVLTPERLGQWFVESQGLNPAHLISTRPGDSHTIDGITIHIVSNAHDNTIRGDPNIDAGPALGYIIRFENGFTVYFAASSAPIPEMRDWAREHQPHLILVNSFNNMGPEFGDIVEYMLTDNPRLQTVIPTHRRVGSIEFFEYQFEVERRGFPVTYFLPELGQPYFF
jgi:L-ascorbate metabolism protein UlaG (beta-lactamase superfamily)